MSTTTHSKRRVLFVDDEPPFLELLGQTMASYSRGSWEILLAHTTSKALKLLQEQPVHCVVVDLHMPVVDGVQFLKLLQRKYPNIPRAVLTGDASEEHRNACLSHGAELFLEKPRSPEGLETVYATLDELAKWQPESGFQGVLRRVGIHDVIQMECLARSSVILEISAKGEVGQIFIEKGAIIHSQTKAHKGEAALNHLLSLTGGQFNLKGFTEPAERTISGSWEFLLMEAARMRDEVLQRENEEKTPGFSATAGGASPAAPCPPEDLSHLQALLDSPDTLFFTQQRTIPPSEPETPGPEPADAEPTPPVPPKVEEFLISSHRGEIVHQWQCDHPAGRLQFLEFVHQKSRQVCQGLPVGLLERLELEGLETRMILRVEGEYACLLRTLREKPGVHVEPASP